MNNEIELLRQKHEAAVKHYNFLLKQKDKAYSEMLKSLGEQYRTSWKWRIGSLFVDNFIIGINFLKNPFRFFADKPFRTTWNGHNFRETDPDSFPIPMIPAEPPSVKVPYSAPKQERPADPIKPAPKSSAVPAQPRETVAEKTAVETSIAAILEEPSELALSSAQRLLSCRPDNWNELLKNQKLSFLLVESAFRGNHGSWQYLLNGSYPSEEAENLISWSQEQNSPTFFWFTCAPDVEDQFYQTASIFDHLLITDVKNRERYRQKFGHDRIHFFPYAVQEKIYNPVTSEFRSDTVCFPGDLNAVFSEDHFALAEKLLPENPGDQELYLYNTRYGDFGYAGSIPDFKNLKAGFHGRIPAAEMAQAYRKHKATLNFVTDPEHNSRISRRVFESLGCGTPVISNFSPEIESVFNDVILFSGSKGETRQYLDKLYHDDLFFMRTSVKGIRTVLMNHTIEMRMGKIWELAGKPQKVQEKMKVSILLDADLISENPVQLYSIRNQTYKPDCVVFLSDNMLPAGRMEMFSNSLPGIRLFNFTYYNNNLVKVIEDSTRSDYYALWDGYSFYGRNYLLDYVMDTSFCKSTAFGKANYFNFAAGKLTRVTKGESFILSPQVPAGSLMLHKSRLPTLNFLLLKQQGSRYYSFEPDIMSTDNLNYIQSLHEPIHSEEKAIKEIEV